MRSVVVGGVGVDELFESCPEGGFVGLNNALLMILFYVAVMDSGLTQKFRGGALAYFFVCI